MPSEQLTNQYSTKVKKVLWIILFFNILVLVIKIFAGIATKSLSILGDAAHSGSDALNNIVGIVVLRFAHEPPDKKHPYGHGKFETLAAFAIVIFLVIACVEIVQGAIGRLIHPVELPFFRKEVVLLLILTLIVNLFVWNYERSQGKKLNNNLLIADASHTGSDVLITISVLASQILIAQKMFWVDSVLALAIASFIAKAAYEIIKSTVPILVDEAWLDPRLVSKSALSISDVTDCYDIYSRRGPYSAFVECKIKVVPKDLYGAHKVADKVEEKLKQDFGNCKITVHVEP